MLVLERLVLLPPDRPVRYAAASTRPHSTTGDDVLPRWSPPGERDVAAFLAFARALDVAVPGLVGGELDAPLHRLATPAGSPLHGDPCARDDLYTAAGLRFVDFERAALGDGSTGPVPARPRASDGVALTDLVTPSARTSSVPSGRKMHDSFLGNVLRRLSKITRRHLGEHSE